MSTPVQPSDPALAKVDPETLVLRAKPLPAMRFRRGLIVGLTGASAAGLITISWLALEPPSFRKAAAFVDAGEPAGKANPDALSNVPSTYGDVPRLGPPLPGDLGRPILEQRKELAGARPSSFDSSAQIERAQAVETERQRAAAAVQAARTSGVMVELGGPRSDAAVTAAQPVQPDLSAPGLVSPSSSAVSPAQRHKVEFAQASDGDVNPHPLRAAPSPWTLSAGTVIPASLITGLNSDLPGLVIAQVTENVRDSATGQKVLVPQGARLLGSYDSAIAYGQRRALVVWKRILLPNGASVDIDNMPATDSSGFAGLEDRVDSHSWQLLKGIAMSTLLGVGTQLSLGGSDSGLARAIRESAQQGAAHAGDQLTSRNLEVQPTVRIRPGWPVRAIVNKDLVLEPWSG